MKLNMIIRKKQIILASLVMILGIAIYLNWQFSDSGNMLSVSNQLKAAKNYGEAQLVNNLSDYFAQAAINRKKAHDEAAEKIKALLSDNTLNQKEKSEITTKALSLAKIVDTEGKIENLIKAKGFSECLVYFDDQKANVIVKTEGLVPSQVAQIKDIIVSQGNIKPENISIVEVK